MTTLCTIDHDALGYILQHVTFLSLKRLLDTGDRVLARRIYDAPTFTSLSIELEDEACYMQAYQYQGTRLAELKHVKSLHLPAQFRMTFLAEQLPPNLVTLDAPGAVLSMVETGTCEAQLACLREINVWSVEGSAKHVESGKVNSVQVRTTPGGLFTHLDQCSSSLTRLNLGPNIAVPQSFQRLDLPCLLDLTFYPTWGIKGYGAYLPALERLDITPACENLTIDLSDLVHVCHLTIDLTTVLANSTSLTATLPYVDTRNVQNSPARRLGRIKLAPNTTHLCIGLKPPKPLDTAALLQDVVEWIDADAMPCLEQLSVPFMNNTWLEIDDSGLPRRLRHIILTDNEYVRRATGAFASLRVDFIPDLDDVDPLPTEYFMKYSFVRTPPTTLDSAQAELVSFAFLSKPDVAELIVRKINYRNLNDAFLSALFPMVIEEWVMRLPRILRPLDCDRDACNVVMALSRLLPRLRALTDKRRAHLLYCATANYPPRLLRYLTCMFNLLTSNVAVAASDEAMLRVGDVTRHFVWLSLKSCIHRVQSTAMAASVIQLMDDWNFARLACKGIVHSLCFRKYPLCSIARRVYKALIAQGANLRLPDVVLTNPYGGSQSVEFGSTGIVLTNNGVRHWCTLDKLHHGDAMRSLRFDMPLKRTSKLAMCSIHNVQNRHGRGHRTFIYPLASKKSRSNACQYNDACKARFKIYTSLPCTFALHEGVVLGP